MRLVDVESAAGPAAHRKDSPTAASPTAKALRRLPRTQDAFTLQPLAKLLNPLLQVFLAAVAKILGASLSPAETDGLGWTFGAGTIQGQAREVPAVRRPGHSVGANAPST